MGLSVCRRLEDLPRSGGAVCFLGYVTGALKQKVYAGCSVVAFSSRWEAFGLVLLEAMVTGRAIIASDLPTVRQILTDGRNGLIVPAENPAAWADAIQKLLSDAALRSQMEQANREDVTPYDWRPIAGSWEKPFASTDNVRFAPGVAPWTDSISHGELLRSGFDEKLEVDPSNLRFLFQGVTDAERSGKNYGQIPWRLGLLEPAR